ncbi:MAG: NAD-binding protein, partial [Planctomycetota bacterium]|nr:NAD-binding protein [Planctomycetota bacterium]
AAAVTTQAIGFSLELGAFLAGFVLSGTPFRHHITGQIGPLRDLFAAVFFTTLGMKIDPASLAQWWWVVLLGSAVMIALKAGVIATTVWSFGALGAVAVTVGLTLAQAGEFSLILLDSASAERILSESAAANAIAIVVLSLIVTPALLALGRRLGPLAAGIKPAPWLSSSTMGPPTRPGRGPDTPARHVVIGGYGPIGRLVAEGLHAAGIHYTIVEVNPGTVQRQSRRGESIVYGDVSNVEVLKSAGLEHADALVITIPDEEAVLRTCAVARRLAPNLIITARTRTAGRASAAAAHGADHVICDEIAAADAMQKAVLQHFAQDQPPQPPTNVGPAS